MDAAVQPGEHVVITGPSGTGKTILLRAVAGIWPFGKGRIELPPHARMLFVSREPYLPLGSLRAAVSYPAAEDAFSDERIREVLGLLDLEPLGARLDEIAPWDERLTGHEQQRLAIARVLLNEPAWVFLDKATSALDEPMEKRVYELLKERLPTTTILSIAHRPKVEAYHEKRWTLAPRDHGPAMLQPA
jgi:putative ATP-binding cassette transporter